MSLLWRSSLYFVKSPINYEPDVNGNRLAPPDYPYQDFSNKLRDIVSPIKIAGTNAILNLVFGSISDVHQTTIVIPVNQDFDFSQRGPRSVLASFENIIVGNQKFYDALDTLFPPNKRPTYSAIGSTHYVQLPNNSSLLNGVMFTVTTRTISTNPLHYGRYANTPIEGIDIALDNVLRKAKDSNIDSIALPLLGTGYANVDIAFDSPELKLLIQQLVLALTIHKLEINLGDPNCKLKRGIVVVYSTRPSSTEEHNIWSFVLKILKKEPSKLYEQIEQLIQDFNEKCRDLQRRGSDLS